MASEDSNPKSNRPRVYIGNAYLVVILPGRQMKVVKVPLNGGKIRMEPFWKSKAE